MTREEYYKKLLYQDLKNGAFGEAAAEAGPFFTKRERELILSGLLRQYQTGSSLDIFNDMVEERSRKISYTAVMRIFTRFWCI